jgi:hypothetical protein
VRQDVLNLDRLDSNEREESLYKIKLKLEQMSELPEEHNSETATFFGKKLSSSNSIKSSFNVWKKSLLLPLHE